MSDSHVRFKSPRYRTDDFFQALMGKIDWIFELAKKENCGAILHGGDLFDKPDISNRIKIDLLQTLYHARTKLLTVYGQHDLRWRKKSDSVLSLFKIVNAVTILNSDPIRYDDNINIYGASWDEEIPEVEDPEAISILVLHKMIVQDGPLWAEQKDFVRADTLLKKYKNYQLIVSGDNHNSFIYTTINQTLINTGSLMRMTTAQRDHTPMVAIYDTETKEATKYLIPIAKIEDVMDLETADDIKEKNEALDAFMDGLSSEYGIELNFEENFKNLMIENKTDNRIKKLGNSFLEKYYEGGK